MCLVDTIGQAIRSGEQSYLNVYRGVAMSVVGSLIWRSVLDDGNSHAVPDFTSEETRQAYENDRWRPKDLDDPDTPPACSSGTTRHVIPENRERAREVWKRWVTGPTTCRRGARAHRGARRRGGSTPTGNDRGFSDKALCGASEKPCTSDNAGLRQDTS